MTDNSKKAIEEQYDLCKFEAEEVLANNVHAKRVVVLGRFVNDALTDKALVILEKSAFTTDDVSTGCKTANAGLGEPPPDSPAQKLQNPRKLFASDTRLDMQIRNDIYADFLCYPDRDYNSIKVTVIRPATTKHVEKYRAKSIVVVEETPACYQNVTLPRLKVLDFSLDWVYNILDHKKEQERVIFEDPSPQTGFVLLPDIKWDGVNVDTLHVIAIVHRRDLMSLRSLNESHLDLLKNIRRTGLAALYNKYKIHWSRMRVYLHYQPSFYHLHVHFVSTEYDGPGITCDHSHLLSSVISNIEIDSEYYQKATLSFGLPSSDINVEQYSDELNREMWVELKSFAGCDRSLRDPDQYDEQKTIIATEDGEEVRVSECDNSGDLDDLDEVAKSFAGAPIQK